MRHYPPRTTGPHTGWSPTRDRAAQNKFRLALIQRAGGRCEYRYIDAVNKPRDEQGNPVWVRCGSTDRLQAHHDKPGYTPDCGRLLCWEHHKHEDPHAR
jgi:hypothetical protein